MKASGTVSVEELRIVGRFEGLRKILLTDDYSHHLDKPLAYWALPTDRRLPLAFLGRQLKDLLDTPFPELSSTPGIGQKKIDSFVKLLSRAANTDPADLPLDLISVNENGNGTAAPAAEKASTNGFDPSTVSEVVWNKWRAVILKHGLGDEMLGRFAPSLKRMTRVIWNSTLEEYTKYSLAEIREMKTHGQKRLNAILEVFYGVHALVSGMNPQDHLVVRLVPRRIDQVEQWIGCVLQRPGIPGKEETFENLISPLLEQVSVDATQQITNLAENRLGLAGVITSVRQAARTMGLTRARVYQLLNEINDIMNVRWPTGRRQMYDLREKVVAEAAHIDNPANDNPANDNPENDNPVNTEQLLAAIELFYPGSRRGAAGPLEQAVDIPSPTDSMQQAEA